MTDATQVTFTEARKKARELGFTLRRSAPGESEIVVYRVGSGMDSPAAYFTDCPADALDTARAMAADSEAPRLSLRACTTERGKAEARELADAERDGFEIGETGEDWEPTDSNRFFAQEPDAGRYAFGRSRIEALRALRAVIADAEAVAQEPTEAAQEPAKPSGGRVVASVAAASLCGFLAAHADEADRLAAAIDESGDWWTLEADAPDARELGFIL